jgi:short-subunit dehydrogenase
MKKFKSLDVLILNAGISGSIPFSDIKDLSLFHKMMNLNFMVKLIKI